MIRAGRGCCLVRTGLAGEIGLSDVLASAGLALVWVVGSVVIGVYKVVRRWRGRRRRSRGNVGGCDPPCPPFVRGGGLSASGR